MHSTTNHLENNVFATGIGGFLRGINSLDRSAQSETESRRVAELEKQLEEQQTLLDEALQRNQKLVGEFSQYASSISHDLGAPVRAIGGFAQLLFGQLGTDMNQTVQHYSRRVSDGANDLKRKHQGLAKFSQVTSKKTSFVDVDLQKIVSTTLKSFSSELEEINASVATGDLPTIFADHDQIAEVIHELIENAIRFRSDRDLELRIDSVESHDVWQISISDNGIGIVENCLESVFMMFRTLQMKDNADTDGVGLTLCRRMVAMNGGTIWVESAKQTGSTFHLRFPKTAEAGSVN